MIAFVSHDIEKTGALLQKHPIVSVGFFVGDELGNKLETFRMNFGVEWPIPEANSKKF